jgi:hypothetical protein
VPSCCGIKFRVTNRAVARALRKRLGIEAPRWHAFQLAFLLLNLPGIADANDPNRATVDLLFSPTGGGKTEAYFGLAAFAMVLRRLRYPGQKGREGAGVSVIMRYTLRLLTLDQLSRAAGLVCALELEREKNSACSASSQRAAREATTPAAQMMVSASSRPCSSSTL